MGADVSNNANISTTTGKPSKHKKVLHPYNVGPTSNATQMYCVRWERPAAHPGKHESASKINTHIYPAETRRRNKADLMLVHRLRRRTNVNPAKDVHPKLF